MAEYKTHKIFVLLQFWIKVSSRGKSQGIRVTSYEIVKIWSCRGRFNGAILIQERMSKADVSPKLERKNDEDAQPVSKASLDTDDGLKSCAENGNSSTNTNDQRVRNEAAGEGRVPNAFNETSEAIADTDQPDGSVISHIIGFDDELTSHNVKLFSCSQQPGTGEGFLKMVVDDEMETGLRVTTTGAHNDPHVLWTTHYTLDNELQQVIIFENKKCSEVTEKKCVLSTQKINDTMDFILTGKKIDSIPRRLSDIDPAVGYYKRPKSIGSELLYLKSMYSTKEKPLLIGFDGAGQPLPLNKVKKYSRHFHAFFRIIPG